MLRICTYYKVETIGNISKVLKLFIWYPTLAYRHVEEISNASYYCSKCNFNFHNIKILEITKHQDL